MKKIAILNLILTIGYVVIYAVLQLTAYNTGIMFALPNDSYLLFAPLFGIISIFNLTIIILFKPQDKWQAVFKWASLVLVVILPIAIFTLPWTYIVFGTSLQSFVQSIIIVMAILLGGLTFYGMLEQKIKVWIKHKSTK